LTRVCHSSALTCSRTDLTTLIAGVLTGGFMAFLRERFGGEYRLVSPRRKAGVPAIPAIQPSTVRRSDQGRTAGVSIGMPRARDIR
jgi:hypothetical protein